MLIPSSYDGNGDVMYSKTFIRLLFLILILASGVLCFISRRDQADVTETNTSGAENKSKTPRKLYGEFIVWESMGETILTTYAN